MYVICKTLKIFWLIVVICSLQIVYVYWSSMPITARIIIVLLGRMAAFGFYILIGITHWATQELYNNESNFRFLEKLMYASIFVTIFWSISMQFQCKLKEFYEVPCTCALCIYIFYIYRRKIPFWNKCGRQLSCPTFKNYRYYPKFLI